MKTNTLREDQDPPLRGGFGWLGALTRHRGCRYVAGDIVGATIGRPPILQRKIGSPQGDHRLISLREIRKLFQFPRTSNARPYRDVADPATEKLCHPE